MVVTVAEVLWRAEVHFTNGLRPCKELVRSTSPERALGKILKRYPWADVERTKVLGQADCSAPVFTPTADYESERLVLDRPPEEHSLQQRQEVAKDRAKAELALRQAEEDQLRKASEEARQMVRHRQPRKPKPQAKAEKLASPVPQIPTKSTAPEKPPAAKAWPTVTPGGFDNRGRRLLSEENARAAAILHHAGRQSWFQLAQVIGVNQDHLRKMARAFYPPGPPQRAPQIGDGVLHIRCKRAADLSEKDARRSLLIHSPGVGWRWCPAGQAKLSKGDWCLRLDDLPTPADPVTQVDPS
jgi:hypothetical protein